MGKPVQHHPAVKALASGLRHDCRWQPGGTVVAAVSGGADSVAMLRALECLRHRRGWRFDIVVGHVQHHLREQAEDDAAFVKALAGDLHLDFARRDLDPSAWQGNLEAAARRARYDALRDMATEFDAKAALTAHHADDQLETLLMRLLRGASIKGLSAMRWRRPIERDSDIILMRPLLGVDRDTLHDYLGQLDQHYCTDATNRDTSRWRARLRHEVLPALKALRADASRKAAALADELHDIDIELRDVIGARYAACLCEPPSDDDERGNPTKGDRSIRLDRKLLREQSRWMCEAVLRKALVIAGASRDAMSRQALGPVIRAVRDRKGGIRRFELAGAQLSLTRDMITIVST